MDPEQALKDAREAAAKVILLGETGESWEATPTAVYELAEAFQALDQWLTRGGHPPADWRYVAMG